MAVENLTRSYWQIPVKHELNLVVKPQPVDLTGAHYYFGELYDGGKQVFGTFAHQSAEKARDEVVEWAKQRYKITGKIRQGRSVPI
jgi:hypothetical protein